MKPCDLGFATHGSGVEQIFKILLVSPVIHHHPYPKLIILPGNSTIDLENPPLPNHFLQGIIGFSSLGYHIRWPPQWLQHVGATRRAATSVPPRLRRAAGTAASVHSARSRAARCCNSAGQAVALPPCPPCVPGGPRKRGMELEKMRHQQLEGYGWVKWGDFTNEV